MIFDTRNKHGKGFQNNKRNKHICQNQRQWIFFNYDYLFFYIYFIIYIIIYSYKATQYWKFMTKAFVNETKYFVIQLISLLAAKRSFKLLKMPSIFYLFKVWCKDYFLYYSIHFSRQYTQISVYFTALMKTALQ